MLSLIYICKIFKGFDSCGVMDIAGIYLGMGLIRIFLYDI